MAYTDLTNSWEYKKPVFRATMDLLAENDEYLKNHGWQTGTKAVFYSSGVPTGWGIDGSAIGRYLRITSGPGGGVGGSYPPNTSFNLSHSHVASADPDHTHVAYNHQHWPLNDTPMPSLSGVNNVRKDDNGLLMEVVNGSGSAYDVMNATFSTFESNNPSSAAGAHQHGINNSGSLAATFYYYNVIIGVKLTSSGYTDLTSFFFYGQKIVDTMFTTMYANDVYNRDRLMPNGSISVCVNPAAPTGWQKLAIHNSRFLVCNTPFGLTGGTLDPQYGYGLNHNHGMTALGLHGHTIGSHVHLQQSRSEENRDGEPSPDQMVMKEGASGIRIYQGGGSNSGNRLLDKSDSGTGTYDNVAAHVHAVQTIFPGSFIPRYVDVISIQKVTGSPTYPFADFTSSLAFKKLVSRQKLDNIGKNDDYVKYHTTPTGTKMCFYQATAPLNWTQSVSNDDRFLRIVTGAGGGTGGTTPNATGLDFRHTHTIDSNTHNHNTSNHKHLWATQAVTNVGAAMSRYVYLRPDAINQELFAGIVGGFSFYKKATMDLGVNATYGGLGVNYTHTHTIPVDGPVLTFAYANVILCDKN